MIALHRRRPSIATLQRFIQTGLITLVALMPFHAFLSVWLGHLTDHQAIIQAWKELLLVVLAGASLILFLRDPETRDRLRTWPVLLAGGFAAIAIIVTLATQPSFTAALLLPWAGPTSSAPTSCCRSLSPPPWHSGADNGGR
jgi:hypothetical protein